MRIFRLSDPRNPDYTRAIRLGSWSAESVVCQACGAITQTRVPPLQIEYVAERRASIRGDFVWPGFDDDVALSPSAQSVLDGCSVIGWGRVEVSVDRKSRGRSSRRASAGDLLKDSSDLRELIVLGRATVDIGRSSIRLSLACNQCGARRYDLEGVERFTVDWDPRTRTALRKRLSRATGQGLFVYASEPTQFGVFRVQELPACILCTESVRSSIETAGLTNVAFLEYGELV